MFTRLISQLAHLEVITPKPEESLKFYRDILGLEVSGRSGQSVYLRGWGEFFHHSLQLTEGRAPALGHIGWRANSPETLMEAAKLIEATGHGEGWFDNAVGHGRAYRYRGPGGHLNELFWEVERFAPAAGGESTYPNRPQRYNPRGVAARQLDHVTVASKNIKADVEWYRDTLGHRFMEYVLHRDTPDLIVFAMLTTCERAHDFGFVPDGSGMTGRVNHISYWVDGREELRRGADVLLDNGFPIEFGPGRHGLGEQDFFYVREPGGMRVEMVAGGYHNYEPDWKPVAWKHYQGSNVYYRNADMPKSMFEAFPPADVPPDSERTDTFTKFV
jgi:catechol 2,3-dioxygenase